LRRGVEENFVLFSIFAYPSAAKGGDEGKPEGANFIDYLSVAKGGKEQNVL